MNYIPMVCLNEECPDRWDAMGEPVCFIQEVEPWSYQVKVGVYLKCIACDTYGDYDFRWITLGLDMSDENSGV